MPDITMCDSVECPRKNECYRYMAKPSEYRQAYSAFQCFKSCTETDYFIPIKAGKDGVK
jgi:hypothetical protein